jgi:ribosomal-protein-alanine N-acetyltransferase
MTTLRTPRLELSPFHARDLDELHALFIDPDVRRFLLDDDVVSPEWVEGEVDNSEARFAEGGCGIWVVREVGLAPIVGFAGYREFFDPPELQLLYGFLPTAWGRGLATEAALEALRYAFDELCFDEVRAATDTPNEASVRVLERLGMHESKRGEDGPTGPRSFAITREDWARRAVDA